MSIQLNQIPRSITESSQNESTSTGHTHAIDKASVTQAGIVKLVDNLDSTSETEALTANQGRELAERLSLLAQSSGSKEINHRLDSALAYMATRYTAAYATYATAKSNLCKHPENSLIYVVNDPTVGNNGLWTVVGGRLIKAPWDVLSSALTSEPFEVLQFIFQGAAGEQIQYNGKTYETLATFAKALEDGRQYIQDVLIDLAQSNNFTASYLLTASGKFQQEINDLTGVPYRVKDGGYDINSRVMLDNGDIVRSTVDGNTIDPNVDMTGWVLTNLDSQIQTWAGRTQRDKNLEYATVNDYQGATAAEQLFTALSDNRLVDIRQAFNAEFTDPTQAAFVLSKLENLIVNAPTTIKLPAETLEFNSNYIAKYTSDHSLLTIIGNEPVAVNIANVVSATGGDGSWEVSYNLSDASDVNVGDYLRISKVECGSAWFQRTPQRKAHHGEMAIGINKMGTVTATGATIKLSGTTAASLPSNWLDVGDLIHIKGQTREIATIDDNTRTLTVTNSFGSDVGEEEFDVDSSRYQWWYYTKTNQGTISVSNGAVTGVGTNFTSVAEDGDILLFDGCMSQIKTVNSDTSITLETAFHNINNIKFTILKTGMIQHEGTWKVTAKTGNQVTVAFKNWNMFQLEARHPTTNNLIYPYLKGFAPPVKGWVGGTVEVLKTVLKQNKSTGHGLVGEQSGAVQLLDNIVIEGGTSTGVGLFLKGSDAAYDAKSSRMNLGEKVAISGFKHSVQGYAGCELHADYAHFMCAGSHSVYLIDGGSGYLRGAVISGSGGIGVMFSGGFIRISEARIIGHKLQGLRTDAGATFYADSAFTYGCASHGLMIVNNSGGQYCDGFTMSCGGNGINIQNGGMGRYSRNLAACNKNHQVSVTAGMIEIGQAWCTGSRSGRAGLVVASATVFAFSITCVGNSGNGVLALNNSNLTTVNSVLRRNGSYGINAQGLSRVVATNTLADSNAVGDSVVTNGATVIGLIASTASKAQLEGALFTANIIISNDSVITIDKSSVYAYVYGFLEFYSSSVASPRGKIYIRTGSSPQTNKESGSSNVAVTTGVLTGTTGTSGNFTISTHTDGKIYLENRTGVTLNITYNLDGRIL